MMGLIACVLVLMVMIIEDRKNCRKELKELKEFELNGWVQLDECNNPTICGVKLRGLGRIWIKARNSKDACEVAEEIYNEWYPEYNEYICVDNIIKEYNKLLNKYTEV